MNFRTICLSILVIFNLNYNNTMELSSSDSSTEIRDGGRFFEQQANQVILFEEILTYIADFLPIRNQFLNTYLARYFRLNNFTINRILFEIMENCKKLNDSKKVIRINNFFKTTRLSESENLLRRYIITLEPFIKVSNVNFNNFSLFASHLKSNDAQRLLCAEVDIKFIDHLLEGINNSGMADLRKRENNIYIAKSIQIVSTIVCFISSIAFWILFFSIDNWSQPQLWSELNSNKHSYFRFDIIVCIFFSSLIIKLGSTICNKIQTYNKDAFRSLLDEIILQRDKLKSIADSY